MKRTLPRELDDLSGMRAARWFRESTAGQWDNFGPDAQREQQDRAIERYGLVDAGLEWSVASSGWTSAWRTATWETMISTAQGGAFDVLVVGYVSRFLRNLKQTLIAVEDHLHTAGVVVLFADERLLSSDPGSWDQFIREAHEAEAYSRKLSKRVSEGYAAKRRRLGVPGGNKMPYGLVREGKPSVLRVDEEQAAVVMKAYQLAATGSTDWEVAAQTGLAKTHVSEVLTNPIYAGRLRTGEPAAIAPIVDPSLWSTVQTRRERRRTRTPGRIVKGRYALRLCCAGCGKYLFGDVGRYRHPAAHLRGVPGGEAGRPLSTCPQPRGHRHPHQGPQLSAGVVRGRGRRAARQGRQPRRPGHDRGRAPLRRGTREARRAHAGADRAGAGGGLTAPREDPRCRRLAGDDGAGSMPSSRWPDSHGSSSAWRPTRSSPTCARYRRSGRIPDPKDARHWPRRCSPSSKWRAIRRCDMHSRPMPLPSVSAQPYRRRRRPVVTQVGLVGARGVAPAWPTCGSGRDSCSRT